jgi:hypothetical protein
LHVVVVQTAAWTVASIALVMVAVLARVAWLGDRQLFRDEAASWLESSYRLPELFRVATTEPYPPLYALLLKAWMAVAGDGEAALRALSAGAALVTVIVAWRWAHEALGRWPGIAVLLVVSLSPVAVANARVARMYSLEAAFATIVWWLVWRLVTGRATTPRARILHAVLIAVAATAEIWMIALGPPMAALQFLFAAGALLAWRRTRSRSRTAESEAASSGAMHAVAALVLAGLSFLFWLPNLLSVATGRGAYWTPTPATLDWAVSWGTMLVGWREDLFAWKALRLGGLVLAAVGVAWLVTRRDAARALLGWAVVGGLGLTVAVWAVSLVRSIYDTRYLEASLPPLAIAVAAGGTALVTAMSRVATTRVATVGAAKPLTRDSAARWATVVGAGLMAAFLLWALIPGTRAWLGEWRREMGLGPSRELIAALKPRLRPGDVLIALDARSYFTVAYEAEMYRRRGDPLPPVRNWDAGNEPFYRGQTLILPEATITASEFAAGGVRGTMPELGDGASVWLLAIANGRREDLDFGPVEAGQLREVDRVVVERKGEAAQARQLRVAP